MVQAPQIDIDRLLRRVPYFAGLSDEILGAVGQAAVPRRYDRGQMIFLEGEPCAGLFVVAEGEVKIFKVSAQGREQVLHTLGPGDTFNDVAVLDGGPNPASAGAIGPVVALVIARAEMQRLAQAYPALAWALIESIARRARHLVEMVEDLALRSVRARLAKLLLAEAERTQGQAAIDRGQMVTQTEMAARLGTVREMVGRALRELADEGLIALDRQRIVINDREGLTEVAET
jgi:CRP/FNR family transcriptional regulator, cyclic AMP receptor protein